MRVSESTLSKAKQDMIYNVLDEAEDELETRFESYDNNIDDIECDNQDGFMAFTNGGYMVDMLASCSGMLGGGNQPSYMTELLEGWQAEHEKEYQECNPNYNCEDDDGEEFYESESEYLGYAYFGLRAVFYDKDNERGDYEGYGSVYLEASYNVGEYCHDNGRTILKAIEIRADKVNEDAIKAAFDELIESMG